MFSTELARSVLFYSKKLQALLGSPSITPTSPSSLHYNTDAPPLRYHYAILDWIKSLCLQTRQVTRLDHVIVPVDQASHETGSCHCTCRPGKSCNCIKSLCLQTRQVMRLDHVIVKPLPSHEMHPTPASERFEASCFLL